MCAFKSPPDENDWIFESIAKSPVLGYEQKTPLKFDLRRFSSKSKNQGNRGTCAAFVAAEIMEIHVNQMSDNTKEYKYFSPEFIYFHRANKPAEGMFSRNVFQVMQKYGSAPYDKYPYIENNIDRAPPTRQAYSAAAKYRINNYAKITSIDGLKNALTECGPCFMLLPLYTNRPEFWRKSINEIEQGGHAVTVVGYDENGFILKNSWGSEWNGDGCIYFPYDEWSVVWECWVALRPQAPARKQSIQMPIFKRPKEVRRKSLA